MSTPKRKKRKKTRKGRKTTSRSAISKSKRLRNTPSELLSASPRDFKALQAHWYAKLESKGFDDIEWTDPKTGRGQNSTYLKRSTGSIRRQYDSNVETHYRLARNFLTHWNGWSTLKMRVRAKAIYALYSEGMPYRKIAARINNDYRYAKTISIFTLSRMLTRINKIMMEWNKTDKEGMLNPANEDIYLEDFKLKD